MERIQQDIVRRHWLASAGALMFSLLFLIQALTTAAAYLPALVSGIVLYWLGQGVMLYFIASGRTQSFTDPGITLLVMIWAVIFLSYTLLLCYDCRALVLLAYLMILPYGIFRLSWRGFLGIALLTMAGYTTVVLVLHHQNRLMLVAGYELIIGAAFLISLMSYSLLGREIGVLREAYRRKNRQLREAMGRIEELAVRDELTGLYNRRYLLSSLERRQALANREGLPFVLAFVDIDHFKQINDQHGHKVGDEVLVELARLLRDSVREVDLVARYGGEEFVLLLNGLTLETAGPALERLRKAVMKKSFSSAGLPLTVSAGVSQYHSGESSDELINRADRLLYDAKRGGRNRVVTESPDEEEDFSPLLV